MPYYPPSSVSNTAYASTWDGDTAVAPSKNAVYDKFEVLNGPAIASGNWFLLNGENAPLATGSAFTANRIYYTPFLLKRHTTLTDLGCSISTGSAGNIAIAIYADASGSPSGTPLANTGNITSTSAAVVSGDIVGVASVTLDPGLYWAAFWSDVTPTLISMQAASGMPTSVLIGSSTIGNVINTGGQGSAGQFSDETYNASAWPNATSESKTVINTVARNYILLGKAA